jgi:hypothetical protein
MMAGRQRQQRAQRDQAQIVPLRMSLVSSTAAAFSLVQVGGYLRCVSKIAFYDRRRQRSEDPRPHQRVSPRLQCACGRQKILKLRL